MVEQDTWELVAPAWERHRTHLFETMKEVSRRLVEAIDPQPGQTVLELAAGPGETGFLVAERIGPSGRLISTDMAPTMVEAARRGAAARGLSNVECRVLDAQAPDLADDSVDAVICRFGFMLMPEQTRAFAEARRVLREGGTLAFATWGAPERNAWAVAIGLAAMQAGLLTPQNPMEPGGMFSLSSAEVIEPALEGVGFSDVRTEEIETVLRYASFDEYWTIQSEVAGGIAVALPRATEEQRETVRETARRGLEPYRHERGYDVPAVVMLTVAR